MTEITVNDQQYRIGKLTAMQQFHVSRRIAPIIPTLIPVFVKLTRDGGLSGDLAGFGEVLAPFADGISKLEDQASEEIIAMCLAVVSRLDGQKWSPVWNRQYKTCMFDDIDLSVMINLAVQVIKDSLTPFIRGLVTSQQPNPIP